MDQKVQDTLSEFYDPAKAEGIMLSLLPEFLISLSHEDTPYYGGLLLFDGLVKYQCGGEIVLADEHMTITGSQVEKIRSLFIKPLERRIKGEYVRLENIQEVRVTSNFRTQHRTPLSVEIDFVSGHVASLGFWLVNGILYVPGKKATPALDKFT